MRSALLFSLSPRLPLSTRLLQVALSLSLCFFTACGSGGGGGGSGGGNDGTRRTSGTGIRIIHGALDVAPVDLKIGESYLNRGTFMIPDFYSSVNKGTQNIILERANSPGVTYFSQPMELADKTEYSLILSGRTSRNTFAVTVLEEPVVRPDSGQARVQLVNALEGSSPLVLNGGGISLGPVAFRGGSGYGVVASGPQTFTVTNTKGGLVGTVTTDLADRGEATIVFGGASSEGVVISKVYTDLD
jgi:hypothetical protein